MLWTQNVSEQNQKYFLCPGHKICVRNKCCARGQTGKHLCQQQCVRNNVSSFARALTILKIVYLCIGLYSGLTLIVQHGEQNSKFVRFNSLKTAEFCFVHHDLFCKRRSSTARKSHKIKQSNSLRC